MRKISLLLSCFILVISFSFSQDYERYYKHLDTSFYSKSLGYSRDITVTVPIEWQPETFQKLPLFIIFDQQNQRSHDYILNTIDYLSSNQQIPSAVIVSISSDLEHRGIETLHQASSSKGMAGNNESFLFEELIPWIEKSYETSDYRLFIGHSRYGYFTTSLLSSKINSVNAVIALSPFFFQKNVDLTDSLEKLIQQDLTYKRYFTFGIGNDYPEDYDSILPLIQQNDNPNLVIDNYYFEDAIHNVTPGLVIAPALYKIFQFWTKTENVYFYAEGADPILRDSLENLIQQHYGSSLKFSLGKLNGKGWQLYDREEYEKAIEAWEFLLKLYPNYTEAYLFILETQLLIGKDYNSTINSFQNSLKTSTFFTPSEKEELLKYYNEILEQIDEKQ